MTNNEIRTTLLGLLEGMLSPTWQRPSESKLRHLIEQLRHPLRYYECRCGRSRGINSSLRCECGAPARSKLFKPPTFPK